MRAQIGGVGRGASLHVEPLETDQHSHHHEKDKTPQTANPGMKSTANDTQLRQVGTFLLVSDFYTSNRKTNNVEAL